MTNSEQRKKKVLKKSQYDHAEASPGFLFWKTYNRWSRIVRLSLEKLDLTQVQYAILAATNYLSSSKKHISQQDISNQLSMDKMMVSDVIKTLEKKELIIRKSHPEDGRAFCLHLTSQAKSILEKAVPRVESTDELFFSKLNKTQRKNLMDCLMILSSNI